MFLCLSSISIHNFSGENTFFEGLLEVRHLTKLDFDGLGDGRLRAFTECMSAFTGIRSLTLRDLYQTIVPEITEGLTILKQLTQLSLEPVPRSRPLRLPTGIVNLQLSSGVILPRASPDVNEYLTDLTSLTNLTSLWIDSGDKLRLFQPGGVTPSQFSRQLSKLKDLETMDVIVDDLFLEALTDVTGLTKLCLFCSTSILDPYIVCPRLSPLSNLEVLKILCSAYPASRRLGLPQMHLPKLRELDLPLSGTDVNMRREVWQTFPCLRQFMLFGRRVPAYE